MFCILKKIKLNKKKITDFSFPDVKVVETIDLTFLHSSSLRTNKVLSKGSIENTSKVFQVKINQNFKTIFKIKLFKVNNHTRRFIKHEKSLIANDLINLTSVVRIIGREPSK